MNDRIIGRLCSQGPFQLLRMESFDKVNVTSAVMGNAAGHLITTAEYSHSISFCKIPFRTEDSYRKETGAFV